MPKKSTIEEMQRIAKNHGGKCISEKYTNSRSYLLWECNNGHQWEAKARNVNEGKWCPKCAKENAIRILKKARDKRRLTLDEMIDIANRRGGKCLSDKYVNSQTKLKWECKFGHQWEAKPADIKAKTWCPICGGTKKLNIKEMHEIAKSRKGKCISNEYKNSSAKLIWQCSRGHQWEATPSKVKGGQWCPKCSNQTSKLEIRIFCEIKTIFGHNQVKWREKINQNECDVYIPNLKIGIEVDGHPWHEGKEENDTEKNNTFSKLGIVLFRVRSERLSLLAVDNIQFKDGEAHIKTIHKLLFELRNAKGITKEAKVNITNYISRNKYSNLKEYRKILSYLPGPLPEDSLQSLYPEISNQWHLIKNHPLQPRMFHPNSNEKMWWLCEKGHEWQTTINHRTSGKGCPFCAGRHQTIEEMQTLAESKEGFCLSEKYLGNHTHLIWKCKSKHIWEATTANIKKGHWCPKCFNKKRGASQRLSISDMHQIARMKNGKCLSTEYVNSHTKLKWECKSGHQWEANANKVRNRGQWCPYCAGKRTVV